MPEKKQQGFQEKALSFFHRGIEGIAGEEFKGKAKEEARKSAYFLFLAFFSIFSLFVLSSLVPLEWSERFVASTVLYGLNTQGLHGSIVPVETGDAVAILLDGGPSIQISYLCTGLLETILLAGVILASAGIPIYKRIIGVAAGAIVSAALNFARIFATIYFIYNSGIETVEFIHNFFFRAFLFISVFCFYALWFRWATGGFGKQAMQKKRIPKSRRKAQ
ncbi:MAG: exosortase/archaeosortase family protein [Candidatus Diapherotrites archaeon]|nr:exosortase/archaeosortase family protein [Candidatus Diapherotrites archaeon]